MAPKTITLVSFTQITALNAQGEDLQSFEFTNAYRGAMHVWFAIAQRLGLEQSAVFNDQTLRVVWETWRDVDRPEFERVTMLSTFDNVLVRPHELSRVAAAFRAFAEAYGPGSLLEQAEGLERIGQLPGVHAVGWCQTSVSQNPWRPWDAEADDHRPFDFGRDEHWFLFDALEEQVAASV